MKTIFTKDLAGKKTFVTREFATLLELTWKAWTNKDMLDKWWTPKPWKAESRKMDFKEGGYWLYAMMGPAGKKHWAVAEYKKLFG